MEGVLVRSVSGVCLSKSNFLNNDHMQYYNTVNYKPRSIYPKMGIRCSVSGGCKSEQMVVMEKVTEMSAVLDVKKNEKKMMKKRMKLVKGLSSDLAMLLVSSEGDLAGGDQELKDASEALLSQLKKLKSEQKELKKKIKEEKAKSKATGCSKKMKMDKKAKTKAADCDSTTSSSSSSESSDSECDREVLDMSRLKRDTASLPSSIQTNEGSIVASLESALNQERLVTPVETFIAEQLALHKSEQDGNSILLSLLEKQKEVTIEKKSKKIEVCMGGKCKRSGAEALLEEFQNVAGSDVEVVGCKCMGKCRDGPNVRLVSPPPIDEYGIHEPVLHSQVAIAAASSSGAVAVADPAAMLTRRSAKKPSYPLCIGVGLDDVGVIVSKFVGDNAAVAV